MPFALQGSSSAGVADALTDVFFDGLALYRPDAARLPFLGERSMGLKQLIDQAALRARAAGMQWAIIGALSEEAGSDGRITWVLSLGLVEALTGKMVKGIRAKTATQELGPWVNSTLSVLLPIVPSAPGSSIPKPKR